MTTKLTADDRAQVKAILLTHAEMQDQRINEVLTEQGRMINDEPDEVDMIADLREQADEFTADSDNLKRIASHY